MIQKDESGDSAVNATKNGEGEAIAIPPGHPPNESGDGGAPKKGYFHKPENRVAFGTLIAVVIYTGITTLIWCTSNRQLTAIIEGNQISSKTLVAGQRAFVNFNDFKSRSLDTGSFGPGKVVGIFFSVINNGNTSTKQFRSIAVCKNERGVQERMEPFELFKWNDRDAKNDVIGPKQSKDIEYCNVSFDQARDIASGAIVMYLLAEVRYFDRLDPTQLHKTQMSERMNISRITEDKDGLLQYLRSSESRGRHNCADDDCPN